MEVTGSDLLSAVLLKEFQPFLVTEEDIVVEEQRRLLSDWSRKRRQLIVKQVIGTLLVLISGSKTSCDSFLNLAFLF